MTMAILEEDTGVNEGKSYMIQQFEKLMSETSSPEEHEVLQSAINRLRNM